MKAEPVRLSWPAKLRQKIEQSPHAPEHILAIHGAGYKFVG